MQTSLHPLLWLFFCINFIQLLNQLLPDEKEKVTLCKLHCISNGRSGLAVSAAICGGCYHRACSLSLALTLPGQISGGAGRFLLGLICPVRSPVPGRRASGHENGGEVVRQRSSRHAWISKLSEGRGIWVKLWLTRLGKVQEVRMHLLLKNLKKTKHFPILASTFPNVFLSIDT